jgi:UDP-N-acetylmuramyl pentapeptide synthase
MKAGLALLSELKTKGKKIYVTPGLVDQGIETERVHTELGKAIAVAKPDELYLMRNSVEQFIESAVIESGYGGKIKVIDEPLKFYQHLETIVAKDDIVMCQNDWPDFYN